MSIRKPVMSSVSSSQKVALFPEALINERKRLSALYHSVVAIASELCDVKIGVKNEDGRRVWIGANKARLKEQSPFFRALWSDPTMKCDEQCDEIRMNGISERSMRAIIALSYAQYSSVVIDRDSLADHLYASLKYDIPLLLECCERTIRSWADCDTRDFRFDCCMETIVKLHKLGMTDFTHKLIEESQIFLLSHRAIRVFYSPIALRMPFDLFSSLVKQKHLDLPEYKIWKRCVEWAVQQCKKEEPFHAKGTTINDDDDDDDDDKDSDSKGWLSSLSDESDNDEESSDKKQVSVRGLDEAEEGYEDEDDEKLDRTVSDYEHVTLETELCRLKPFIKFDRMNEHELESLSQWQSIFTRREIDDWTRCDSETKTPFRVPNPLPLIQVMDSESLFNRFLDMKPGSKLLVKESVGKWTVSVSCQKRRPLADASDDRMKEDHSWTIRTVKPNDWALQVYFVDRLGKYHIEWIPIREETICDCKGICSNIEHLLAEIPLVFVEGPSIKYVTI